MINYGKIAYNKVNDIVRDNNSKTYNFNMQTTTAEITESNTSFSFNLCSVNKVFFTFDSTETCDFKVLVNNVCEYACVNTNFNTFGLFLSDETSVTVVVSNCTYPTKVNLTIVGNFVVTNTQTLSLITLNNNLMVIKNNTNSFTVFNSDIISNTILNYNNLQGETYNYKFVSGIGGADCNYILAGSESQNVVIANMQTEIKLSKIFSSLAKIFVCTNFGASFGVVDFNLNKVTLVLFNLSGEVVFETELEVEKLKCITNISAVTNVVDNLVYFTLSNNNLSNFIVLCNFNENSQTASLSALIELDKSESVSVVKITETNFLVSVKQDKYVKVNVYNFNFTNYLKTLISVAKHNNAHSVGLINLTDTILNFNNTLVLN